MRLVMAQCNFTVGDIKGNQAIIIDVIETWGEKADIIVFSELAIVGYYPMDLIDRPGFLDAQNHALQTIKAATKTLQAAVVIGMISQNPWAGKPFHNALVVYHQGVEAFQYQKKLLPTYNIFDEARHFEPGQIPGTWSYLNKRIGFLICEDGWNSLDDPNYRLDPVDQLAREQLDLVISINASPSNEGKLAERIVHFSRISQRCQAPLVYVNQVGGNDEIIFDGQSFFLNAQGQPVDCLPGFTPAQSMVDLSTLNTLPEKNLSPMSDLAMMHQQLTLGIRDYVNKCGFKGALIGASGGIDSAVTLALAVAALGSDAVIAVTMPSRFSSTGSVDDSMVLCKSLGIPCYTASIEEEFATSVKQFETVFGQVPSTLTQENMQARIRGKLLMAYSNHFGHLVLSTGNKTEMSVGYATLYGDMNGGLNVLGDVYKMEVYALAHFINETAGKPVIPNTIIHKAPSAELSEGQKDEDSLPPYPVLDASVRLLIERDLMTPEEVKADLVKIQSIQAETFESIARKLDRAEFKRRQAPPILRVHRRSFGIGRRFPIAQRFQHQWDVKPIRDTEHVNLR